MSNPLIYLFTIAIIWPLGQLLELPTPFPQAHLYGLDVLVFLLFLSLITQRSHHKAFLADPLTKPYLLFTFAASFSLLVAAFNLTRQDTLVAFAYLLRWVTYPSIYYAITLQKKPQKLLRPILYSLLAFTLLGLLQYSLFPDVRSLFGFGFDDHFYRLVGTLFDPNFTGLVMVILIIFLLQTKDLPRFLIILPTIALSLTFSRASFLSLVASLAYIALKKPRKIYLAIFALVVVAIFLSPKPYGEGVNLFRTFSISSRIDDAHYGLDLLAQKPIFGHGYNALRSIKSTTGFIESRSAGGLANSYIFILATTGLVGFAAYLFLLRKIYQLSPHHLATSATLIAIFVHSLFNNSLFYIWILALLWSLTAIARMNRKL